MPYQVPQSVRTIIPPLAEAVLAVQAWIKPKAPPRYDQFIPKLGSVPWRPGAAEPMLSTANFEIVRYLELLVDGDGENVALAPRWNTIKADPTKFFQSRSGLPAADWRRGRQGLAPGAKFGAFDPDSSNFAFVGQESGGPLKAMSRMEFYEACWGPLTDALQFKPPSDAAGWVAFRDNLRTDQFTVNWPTSKVVKSSAFIRQFTLDVLRACLGQRNDAITAKDPVWQRAVLIEVGENRRPDDPYTVQDAGQAVGTFTNAI